MGWKKYAIRFGLPVITAIIRYFFQPKECKAVEDEENKEELEYMEKQLAEKLKKMVVAELKRTYHEDGTNGVIETEDGHLFLTIELPWLNNQQRISCIPEGEYKLSKRTSERFGKHVHVDSVPHRSNILFHAANVALEELAGCIAPVSDHIAPGRGTESRVATQRFRNWVYGQIDSGKDVILKIST